jgi:hypothetical protein
MKYLQPELSMPKLLAKAQKVFNFFIRNRDKDRGCISCQAPITEAGHYYSQGHHSALRFNETNTNGQCKRCNRWLSGNLIKYRNGLVKRYSQQQIDLLDSVGTRNPVKKWSRVELELIIEKYDL